MDAHVPQCASVGGLMFGSRNIAPDAVRLERSAVRVKSKGRAAHASTTLRYARRERSSGMRFGSELTR